MIRKKYQENEVDFQLSKQQVPFQNEALLDVVIGKPSSLFAKAVSSQM